MRLLLSTMDITSGIPKRISLNVVIDLYRLAQGLGKRKALFKKCCSRAGLSPK